MIQATIDSDMGIGRDAFCGLHAHGTHMDLHHGVDRSDDQAQDEYSDGHNNYCVALGDSHLPVCIAALTHYMGCSCGQGKGLVCHMRLRMDGCHMHREYPSHSSSAEMGEYSHNRIPSG